jgi:hypothetical protein
LDATQDDECLRDALPIDEGITWFAWEGSPVATVTLKVD